MKKKAVIVGGGLAGVEAAYQLVSRGLAVELYEMRPELMTEAHTTGQLAEMVCSNSLGASDITSASGLLKQELRTLDSFFLKMADRFRVPAGNSLSVDRLRLAEGITREVASWPDLSLVRREVREIPASDGPVIIASGPLTSPSLSLSISGLTARKNLFFFDATSPLIATDSIDFSRMFAGSRYNKGEADFYNIPLDQDQYDRFVREIVQAEKAEIKDFEKNIFFEACQPIEEIAARGEKSLSYGPLKPVGLVDPRTNRMPHAVVQLRVDDLNRTFYQLVGFQTRLKWGEQRRIFRSLPGLEKAEFERYGRMHRNTYINSPLIINSLFQSKTNPRIYFSGQLSGIEGYVESVAAGLLAGLFAGQQILGRSSLPPPLTSAVGSLAHYIANASWKDFRPTKFSFGLIPDSGIDNRRKEKKKELKAERALEDLRQWKKRETT